MKKLLKRTGKWFVAFLGICLMMGAGMTASAANKYVPSRVHITTGYNGYQNYYETPLAFDLKVKSDRIANLKSSSSNLLVRQVYKDIKTGEGYFHYHVGIGLYARKNGKYTVKFDVLDKNGKKKCTEKVTVYATREKAVKKITYGGKTVKNNLFTTKRSGKLKITMNKGYKLKKIEIGTKKDGTDGAVYKRVKNNAVLKMKTSPDSHNIKEGSLKKGAYKENYWSSLWAYHDIRITYVDKYTGQTAETYASISYLTK